MLGFCSLDLQSSLAGPDRKWVRPRTPLGAARCGLVFQKGPKRAGSLALAPLARGVLPYPPRAPFGD